jgi:hypothetical protein
MFVVIMSKTHHILLLLCLVLSCNRAPNPSTQTTSADSSKYTDSHNHYAGKLSGTWYRNQLGARATLTLEAISPDRVQFSITALSGTNTGDIDGYLTVDGVSASFKTESEEYGDCYLMFDGSVEGSIRIEQEGCTGYGSEGVMFLGLYDRRWTPDETLALAVLEERYGVDITREIQFKAGSDFDIFAASLQMESTLSSNDEFSDVSEFFVKGQRGSVASCVAVNNESGEIWIAYVRDNALLYSGDLENSPTAFQEWVQEMVSSFRLELVHKTDPS